MTPALSLEQIEEAIALFDRDRQQRFLNDLPRLLHISDQDIAILKTAEPSFEFWNNSEDEIYDHL